MLPPPSHTPLIALPALVLDLETTGLDVTQDRVVQVGAIAMLGDVIQEETALDQLVNPAMAIPAASSRIHGIHDTDIIAAPLFKDVATRLKKLFDGRVVIGHNIGFDMAILRHESARAELTWPEPLIIDVGQLLGALRPSLPDLGLETMASYLGVAIQDRHTAIGDCLIAARAWIQLNQLLREQGIRTLGEAVSLARQREDLTLRQAHAGWFSSPANMIKSDLPKVARIDSYVFEHRLQDVMHGPIKMIEPEMTLRQAAQKMIKHQIGALLIGCEGQSVQGIFTEHDLLQVTAKADTDLDSTPVSAIMSQPVVCMASDEFLYRALGRMNRLGIRHLCVVNPSGTPVGMISQRDLLHHRALGSNILNDAITTAEDTPTLAAAFARVTSVAAELVSEGLGGIDVAQVISSELQNLTCRTANLCRQRMQAEGRGTPPADWCVLVLGSGGRGESLLSADQDNALIHTGTEGDDPWFAEFGQMMADLLDMVGVARCKGEVMASSPQWRGNVSDWNHRVDTWLRRAHPKDLLNVDIFYDLVPVAGNMELARRLRTDAIKVASTSPVFLGLMAQSVQALSPRFSLFGRLTIEAGRINLKRDGLLPLVSFARALALRTGSEARSTPDRLRDAVAANRLSDGDAEQLIELHKTLLTHVLHQQLRDIDAGVSVSNTVEVKELSRQQYSRLIHGLRYLNTMISETQGLISG